MLVYLRCLLRYAPQGNADKQSIALSSNTWNLRSEEVVNSSRGVLTIMLSQARSSTIAIPSIAAGSDCATSFHRPEHLMQQADCAVR